MELGVPESLDSIYFFALRPTLFFVFFTFIYRASLRNSFYPLHILNTPQHRQQKRRTSTLVVITCLTHKKHGITLTPCRGGHISHCCVLFHAPKKERTPKQDSFHKIVKLSAKKSRGTVVSTRHLKNYSSSLR